MPTGNIPPAVRDASMSDGSAFAGALAASPAGTVTISGNKLVLARALTSADDGPRHWTVAATQNGGTGSGAGPDHRNAPPTPVPLPPRAACLPPHAAPPPLVASPLVSH